MKDFDKALDWLEDNTKESIIGINLIVEKMYAEFRDVPDRVAMVRLILSAGRKFLEELAKELSLDWKVMVYHEKALERIGVLTSELDYSPEGYTDAIMVRYVSVTSFGERMLKYLDSKVSQDE